MRRRCCIVGEVKDLSGLRIGDSEDVISIPVSLNKRKNNSLGVRDEVFVFPRRDMQ